MIWSDNDIVYGITAQHLVVEPFTEEAIQPASLDLRLGDTYVVYKHVPWYRRCPILDPAKPTFPYMTTEVGSSIIISSGGFILGATVEHITLCDFVVGRVEGKSSIGRLGMSIHTTAGFIDPGFSGHVTLELTNHGPLPIRLYAGMWIAQLALEYTKTKCDKPYGKARGSRYSDQNHPWPVESRIDQRLK